MARANSPVARLVGVVIALSLGAMLGAPFTVVAATGDTGSGIEGSPWTLARQLVGSELEDVPEGVMATLLLDAGTATGSAGCNSFSGPYTLGEGSLVFGPLMSTLMLCADPTMAVETAYLAHLGLVTSFELERDGLSLLDAGGEALLVYEAVEVPSIEGAWIATGYVTSDRDLVSPEQGSLLTAVFGIDGTVEGHSGCNHFTGTYTVDGGDITIGPLASTRMACASPELQTQETDFLAALTASTQWSRNGTDLELVDAEGLGKDTTATFTAEVEPTYIGAWTVTGYDKGNGSITAPVGGATLPLVFGVDGTVEGSSGCNDYAGPYTVSGRSMTIGPLASTRVACADADLAAQEQQLLTALQVVASWAPDGDGLVLGDLEGATQVTVAP